MLTIKIIYQLHAAKKTLNERHLHVASRTKHMNGNVQACRAKRRCRYILCLRPSNKADLEFWAETEI